MSSGVAHTGSDASFDAVIEQDVRDLHQLGYAQELRRVMSGFSNFAISFSIISILTGAVILYGWGLRYGGPGENGWGWPIVSLFTLCIAASMAEIASAYPTAGGLYYWASVMGSRHWGWWTAWLNLGGLVTAVAGINWAAAAFFNRIILQEMFGITPDLGKQVVVMAVITLVQVIVNVFGIRLVAFLNDLSVWVHVFGVVAIALVLFLFAKHRNGIGFPFQIAPGDPVIAENLPFWGAFGVFGAFLLGLLQAQWTYTGYDASAHTAEETIGARRSSANGIFMSVLVSAVVGYVLLMAITYALPPIPDTLAAEAGGTPAVAYTLIENLGQLGVFFAFVIVVAMILCGMSAIASTGRMIYAFARDGGVPFAGVFSHVSRTQRTPDIALATAGLLAVLITVYAYVSGRGDAAAASVTIAIITGMSTALLYWAYGLPILLGLRSNDWHARRAWSLGGKSRILQGISVVWIIIISILFLWRPDNEYAFRGTVGFMILLALYYVLWARRNFPGPQVLRPEDLMAKELEVGETHHGGAVIGRPVTG
ncbi:MAG: amino acid permease [Thermomicrobiales bacterium]